MAPKRRLTQTSSARDKRARKSQTAAPRSKPREEQSGVLWKHEKSAPLTSLDPNLALADPKELLQRFVAPVSIDEFMQKCWAKRALAVRGAPTRLKRIINNFLHDLHLDALLSETPSERVHAWVKPASGRTEGLESVGVDAEAARTLARAGAALYFRAPEELEGLLVPGLLCALGSGFAGRYPGDGRPRGEIETFVASKGHMTGWHTDFQHNFTLQLQGAKSWRFKKGPVEHNVRALTPHYQTRAAYEQQMKLHLLSSPSSTDFRPPDEFFADAEEVTLTAGDMLYHPAGIWHRVDTVSDDSISINVSLTIASWAELFGDALRQLLWDSPALRAPVVGLGSDDTMAKALVAEVRRSAMALKAEDLLPQVGADMETPPRQVNLAKSQLGAGLSIDQGDTFIFSRLASVVPLEDADVSSSGSEDESEVSRRVGSTGCKYYALHVNFGNEDVASWLRIRLKVPRVIDGFVAWLCNRQLAVRQLGQSQRHEKGGDFTVRELLVACSGAGKQVKVGSAHWNRVGRLLRILVHCGYLRKVPRGACDKKSFAK